MVENTREIDYKNYEIRGSSRAPKIRFDSYAPEPEPNIRSHPFPPATRNNTQHQQPHQKIDLIAEMPYPYDSYPGDDSSFKAPSQDKAREHDYSTMSFSGTPGFSKSPKFSSTDRVTPWTDRYPTRRAYSTDDVKLDILEYFGTYPNVPTINILKLCSIILLVMFVELNNMVNLATLHPSLVNVFGKNPGALFGISLIGLFLGILFRYTDFEFRRLKALPKEDKSARIRAFMTLLFLTAISIFIVIEIIIELLTARKYLALLDLMNILIVTMGTYAVFGGKRNSIISVIILIFITMLIGIDYSANLPMLVLLGSLLFLFIEVTDGAIRLQNNIKKFHDMIEDHEQKEVIRNQVDMQMNKLAGQYIMNLSIVFTLTLVISGLLLLIYISYPYITPSFINENLELQSVYAILPIIVLLFTIFLFIYLVSKYITHLIEKSIQNSRVDQS